MAAQGGTRPSALQAGGRRGVDLHGDALRPRGPHPRLAVADILELVRPDQRHRTGALGSTLVRQLIAVGVAALTRDIAGPAVAVAVHGVDRPGTVWPDKLNPQRPYAQPVVQLQPALVQVHRQLVEPLVTGGGPGQVAGQLRARAGLQRSVLRHCHRAELS